MKQSDVTRYELPPEGITLLGYVVRRMHKTQWLLPVRALLADGRSAEALARIAMYTVVSSTSFGPAYYQPRFNSRGDEIRESDPQTGAVVWARLESASTPYKISYAASLPDGGEFSGAEEIQGTTVGLRGLGMPAPSRFQFMSGDYRAQLSGIITSELALSLFGNTRIRAFGSLNMEDTSGNSGKLTIDRDRKIDIQVNGQTVRLPTEDPA
jgi:hypothetical protein